MKREPTKNDFLDKGPYFNFVSTKGYLCRWLAKLNVNTRVSRMKQKASPLVKVSFVWFEPIYKVIKTHLLVLLAFQVHQAYHQAYHLHPPDLQLLGRSS